MTIDQLTPSPLRWTEAYEAFHALIVVEYNAASAVEHGHLAVDNRRVVGGVRFRMLGPVRVRAEGGWVPVAAGRQRLVLAVLLADAGHVVSTERLIDAVWANRPPPGAANTIRVYVMRLRRLLGRDALATRDGGYELMVGGDDVDAVVFERLIAAGRREVDGDRLEAGVSRLAEALVLWRGPVFADVPTNPWLTSRAAHLEQLRLTAEEEHAGALLDLHRHAQVVDE